MEQCCLGSRPTWKEDLQYKQYIVYSIWFRQLQQKLRLWHRCSTKKENSWGFLIVDKKVRFLDLAVCFSSGKISCLRICVSASLACATRVVAMTVWAGSCPKSSDFGGLPKRRIIEIWSTVFKLFSLASYIWSYFFYHGHHIEIVTKLTTKIPWHVLWLEPCVLLPQHGTEMLGLPPLEWSFPSQRTPSTSHLAHEPWSPSRSHCFHPGKCCAFCFEVNSYHSLWEKWLSSLMESTMFKKFYNIKYIQYIYIMSMWIVLC